MAEIKTAPFGSWQSPITSNLIVSESIGLGAIALNGQDIYWLEGRPSEGGRYVLVKQSPNGDVTDVTPPPFNVRTRVHEYGGGAFLVAEGTIYFSNDGDKRLYQTTATSEPQPLTEPAQRRYADAILDKSRNRLICVCEDHTNPNSEPINHLVAVNLTSGKVTTLVSGSDFYSSPRLSPDGTKLAWLQWNHPHLPWDSTQLYVAPIDSDGTIGEAKPIVGNVNESVLQPEWSPDGQLYFVWEKTGWWNLYRQTFEGEIESLWEMEAEFGYPHWVFGLSHYAFVSPEQLICSYTQNGSWYLASLNTETKQLTPINTPYTSISSLTVSNGKVAFIGGSPTKPTEAITLSLETGEITVLKRSTSLEIESGYLSTPEQIEFPTENGQTAYAWFYPPQNQDYTAPEGEKPPLIVKSHGGPTAAASSTFSLKIQYWTSRGFAFADVNYGGSIGYGREYRQRLDKQWGIVDVNDCANVAKYLAKQGKVDGDKLAITGGSAGGYTTLAALTFTNTFKAGASHYGVSDLETLATDTHKFESRYLDRLIGKYPEEKEIYQKRSPIHYTDQLSCPVIFFQGLEDKVVPPSQAETMVNSLAEKGLPVAYVPFEGEQHGFRQAENIKRALDGEYYFYSRVFGFDPGEEIEPIEILNL